jgi:periplasmic divalent cation tolerance protein
MARGAAVTELVLASSRYVIVYTTFADRGEAIRMAHDLVERHLAACAQIHEIASVYRWQGNVEEATEYMLTIKTAAARVPDLKAHILATHSYEVPEFLVVPVVAGHDRYLAWIDENTGSGAISD